MNVIRTIVLCICCRLINSDFASATVLISFGAVLGKISPIQLLVMGLIEVVLYEVNEYIVFDLFFVSHAALRLFKFVFTALTKQQLR
jgi:ammonium transporter Rh